LNKNTELFETTPIPKAVMSFSVPMMLGMLVTVVYIIIDMFFVAQTGDPNQVAALTISTPVFMLCMAFANIFGIGGASYISRLLGLKDEESAKRTSAFVFYMSLAIGVVASAALLPAMDILLPLIGATEQTWDYTRGYLVWTISGASMIILRFGMGEIVRCVGAAKEAMIGMLVGTIMNIILDPIFIFTFDMGVVGAAVATVISNAVSVAYFIWLIVRKGYPLSISPKHFKPDKKIVMGVLGIGVPATLRELLMSASQMVFNYFGARHGEMFLAAIGIVNTVVLLPIMAVMGLSQGIQPLLGYTYTANLHKRLRGVLNYTLIVATASAAVLTLVIYLFGGAAVSVFINNAEVIEQGRYILYRLTWSIPVLAVLFVLSTVFQALGKAKEALILSIARQGIVLLPVLFIFNYAFGRDGLIFAIPIADTLSMLICIGLFLPVMRSLGSGDKERDDLT
jgi:putative MATE family efflux protein